MKDCLFLVADGAIEAVLKAYLDRERFMEHSLGCNTFTYDIRSLGSDSGVLDNGVDEARRKWAEYPYFVLILDSDFDDRRAADPDELRARIEAQRQGDDERERIVVIVIEPELENWIWAENTHVAAAFEIDKLPGFAGRIQPFLAGHTYPRKSRKTERRYKDCWEQVVWPEGAAKPPRPKEAAEWVCELGSLPRSNSIYKKIAENMSIRNCSDAAFLALKAQLQAWFPLETPV